NRDETMPPADYDVRRARSPKRPDVLLDRITEADEFMHVASRHRVQSMCGVAQFRSRQISASQTSRSRHQPTGVSIIEQVQVEIGGSLGGHTVQYCLVFG